MDTPEARTETKTMTYEEIVAAGKVIVFFKPTGDVPELKTKKFKMSITGTFLDLITFLRKQLKLQSSDPLCLFVKGAFQPSADQAIEDLIKVQTSLLRTNNFSVF
eukprot:TRINITY_DN1021_c0_g2_i3.p1 TRINITY_DN1021_c0_g2~~TRINITY_DN1021_c0_g2_i3.p1  ORF type:complete len:105 (+),score=22.14 TRINITY_DN1021_c0_g2_i3:73-387(+)